jgi:hypothetical protein
LQAMKSGLRLFCIGSVLLISIAAPAQRKWRRAWEKAWQQMASCKDSFTLFSCMRQQGFADSLYDYTLVQWMGKAAGKGTSLKLNEKQKRAGTDFFPLPYSGEGGFDADVLAGIQELNKPWLINLQTVYAVDSSLDSLQAIYASARQAQQNGATAWMAYGVLPQKWMQTRDTAFFPRLSIPVVYLQGVAFQEGARVHLNAHIHMKDSVLTASLMRICGVNHSSPVLWLICSVGDVQASWLAMLSRAFLHQSGEKEAPCIVWMPAYFPPALAQAFAAFILQGQMVPVRAVLVIHTDASLSYPRLQICRQADYWRSLLQPDVSKSWSTINVTPDEFPFQLLPLGLPVAHLWVPRVSSSLGKQPLSMHQQIFELIRRAGEVQTGMQAAK